MSTARSEHLTRGYSSQSASQTRSASPSANNSPIDPPLPSSRSPFGMSGGLNPSGKMASNSRSGAGSPSHEMAGSSRLFSKRLTRSPSVQSSRDSGPRRRPGHAGKPLGRPSHQRQLDAAAREHP
ncbi:hypothetical protein AUP68_13149 [Ilyonectria robusta]